MPGRRAPEPERRAQILAAAMSVATREGLDRLTVRRVAAAADLSHGLVHFHYQTKADLTSALLARVLHATLSFESRPPAPRDPPTERLLAVMLHEMQRLAADPGSTRLFFDFWLAGARQKRLRTQMRRALLAYQRGFRPLVEDVLAADPARFSGVTAAALGSVVVAFIKGSALQAMIDPRGFDPAEFTEAAKSILGGVLPIDELEGRRPGGGQGPRGRTGGAVGAPEITTVPLLEVIGTKLESLELP